MENVVLQSDRGSEGTMKGRGEKKRKQTGNVQKKKKRVRGKLREVRRKVWTVRKGDEAEKDRGKEHIREDEWRR